ncbi:MAG TPA: bifunctional 5,10-methylenetetrahydrofolate dehydrogenase/5,10-methenyltetrahydrofolate cyclohydrolase [Patescibacteria group bacterium]|nr:bifunctional 5,10-methylenetetrahydrofolate dehydrogenase/5,10-methenyltetrahydrofolate cyclohydrolase [Patescibacteria group bacterium]
MLTFNGVAEAVTRKYELQKRLQTLPKLGIFSLVFSEDEPSKTYAKLKQKDAASLGISYEIQELSVQSPLQAISTTIQQAAERPDITGIIVQKPAKSLEPTPEWWETVVLSIPKEKDVDGLTKDRLVLPATAKAIMEILLFASASLQIHLSGKTAIVIGRSPIVGIPVSMELEKRGMQVHLYGRNEFYAQKEFLKHADVLITATGTPDIVTASMLKKGVIVIDAGSPKPEVNTDDLDQVASFLSPVPGGVGPMTRVCLLENLLDLVR